MRCSSTVRPGLKAGRGGSEILLGRGGPSKVRPVRRWFPLASLLFAASCFDLGACPSLPARVCNPRDANCPRGYTCALSEICTRTCEADRDCWVKVEDGCRYQQLPGETLPDGGAYTEQNDEGFCPESRLVSCIGGFCELTTCLDGGCDHDLYGPSPFKGNRSQGPAQ